MARFVVGLSLCLHSFVLKPSARPANILPLDTSFRSDGLCRSRCSNSDVRSLHIRVGFPARRFASRERMPLLTRGANQKSKTETLR